MLNQLKKLLRFAGIYGIRRSIFKAAGRKRILKAKYLNPSLRKKIDSVSVIGCGQFAFATIGAVLTISSAYRYRRCFDIEKSTQISFESFYDMQLQTDSAEDIFSDPGTEYVYIASNHASHTDYAIAAIRAKKIVYIEKPISVNWQQFADLCEVKMMAVKPVYVGYNRPHSAAIRDLKPYCLDAAGPITLAFTICGHMIGPNHWYRKPEEGSRICGNLGHWLDLAVHIMTWRRLEDCWNISILATDHGEPDDNVCIVLRSVFGDLVTLVLTSRNEPFEGISESILLQWGEVNAKIDDFRSMGIRIKEKKKNYHYWPKDVGHKRAIMQPFLRLDDRWNEVQNSTALMLTIAKMVANNIQQADFSFTEVLDKNGILR